jgi:hypothetical protein
MCRQLLPALQVAAMMIASLAWVGGDAARASDTIVLNANRYDVLAGRYSAFAKFQTNLQRVLNDCGKGLPSVVPVGEEATGKIGLETRRGIQRALRCEALRSVPTDSAAHDGIITESVWHAVMGAEPVPSVVDRANALVLSFEATDFGEGPEWNFCQDSKRGKHHTIDPKVHDFVCYNTSDPCSYLTWGPRGATAGSGREIQWVLWLVLKRDPSLVEKAFGKEFPNVERFLRLKSSDQKEQCETDTPLARFMCAIWLDPRRRKIWEDALATLGRSPLVRAAYAQLYALIEFDGEKLRDFDELWRRLGLVPNEVDYAFFLDRVTHLDGPPDDAMWMHAAAPRDAPHRADGATGRRWRSGRRGAQLDLVARERPGELGRRGTEHGLPTL